MTTERLIAACAVAGFILTLFVGAITGTFVLGTTFATQDQVRQTVDDVIVPLATEADVVREVGSINTELAGLPTSDEVASLVAAAVSADIATAIAPLATQNDLAALTNRLNALDVKTNAMIDCMIDLRPPTIGATPLSRNLNAQTLNGQDPSPSGALPNSCLRAQALARE